MKKRYPLSDPAKTGWIYYNPVFLCDPACPDLYRFSPWAGLRNFAYDYVRAVRPQIIVELGSHYGCSSFAILQAVLDGHLNSRFFAVDTWRGDYFTAHDYAEDDIFRKYCAVERKYYSDTRARHLRMTFDEALERFPAGSIDLLHIDGSHFYQSVKHDFESWLPKMSSSGVIWLHDVGDDLFEGKVLGSCVYWKELRKKYGGRTAEIPYSCGLGIVYTGKKTLRSARVFRRIRRAAESGIYRERLFRQDTLNKAALRERGFRIASQTRYIAELEGRTGEAGKA